MKRTLRTAVYLLCVAAALAPAMAFDGLPADPATCASPMPSARNFLLRDLDNQKWTFSSTRGKVVLVDFWATWCVPCKVEIPAFVDLYARYKANGLEVVGISMDTDPAAMKSFAAEYKMTYPILRGTDNVTRTWGVEGLPTTVLVGRDGKVCRKFVGQTPLEQFEQLVKSLL